MNIKCVSAALMCLAIGACSDQGSSPLGFEALERWKALGVHDYVVRQERLCFCLNAGRVVEIVVRSDTIASVTAVDGQSDPIEKHYYLTVDGLFATIASAQEQSAAKIEVVYHELYGYPERISIDYIAQAVDDEIWYRTYDFRPIR